MPSADQVAENLELACVTGGNANRYNHFGKQFGCYLKLSVHLPMTQKSHPYVGK